MPEQILSGEPAHEGHDTSDEVHLLDLLIVIARHKKLVVLTPMVIGAVALTVSLLMDTVYTSSAKILPPQQAQSSGIQAMLGQLGGLAGAAGTFAGIKNPNDLYVGLLESRTIADRLIVRFDLKKRYDKKLMDDTRLELSKNREIVNSKKDGLITISATDKDPQFAAQLANAYVAELARLTESMALSEASQRRMFFEKQLQDAKDRLAGAEVALRNTQQKTGLIQPTAQVGAIITSIAQLKATIAAKDVQIKSMRTFAAGQNPDLLRAEEEYRSLRAQLAQLERSRPTSEGDFMVPTGKIPEVAVDYVRAVRDVKYYETLFELLAKQFELAKIDEAKDASTIQLLDTAVPAEKKSGPKRALITLGGIFGGALLGVILAFIIEAYRKSSADADSRMRWQRLATTWKPKRGP